MGLKGSREAIVTTKRFENASPCERLFYTLVVALPPQPCSLPRFCGDTVDMCTDFIYRWYCQNQRENVQGYGRRVATIHVQQTMAKGHVFNALHDAPSVVQYICVRSGRRSSCSEKISLLRELPLSLLVRLLFYCRGLLPARCRRRQDQPFLLALLRF